MKQDRQFKKVKTYRTLKVVFYCLGLPLFLFAVFLSAFKFIGNDPFTGTSEFTTKLGFFQDMQILFSSPALYGIWIAFAIWLVIAIVHIILSKTVKSRRTRMFSMMAVTLVVMLGSMFVLDAVLGAKIDKIAAEAPAGVTVDDYKTQLSYYRTISSYRHSKNMTENLIAQVALLENVYNVEKEGVDKNGNAGSIGNKPITYKNIIDDEGNEGVDISFKINSKGLPELDYDPTKGNLFYGDGAITDAVEGKQEIRLAPSADGSLVINGITYSHYYYFERKSTKGDSLYTWYTKDLLPVGSTYDGGATEHFIMDGIYGRGIYNPNGMLADGWVYSLENALYILRDYYKAKEAIDNGSAEYYNFAEIYAAAVQKRDNYYNRLIPDDNGEYVDPWLSALYNQEIQMNERFSLTRGELDQLIAKVGALLGNNALFDYLFINGDTLIDGLGEIGGLLESFIGGALGDLFKQLNTGMSFSSFGLDAATLKTVIDILKPLTDNGNMIIDDLYLTVAYKANDSFGRPQDHLFIGLVRGEGKWYLTGTDTLNAVLARDENGAWVYQGIDGTEFVPNVKYFDSREVVEEDGVWIYADGTGEVTDADFEPVVKYFVDQEVEVKQDENGNWIYANDANTLVGSNAAPVAKYYIVREVKHELGNWIYADDNSHVVGTNFVPSIRYYDANWNELILNADGDAFLYADGTKFSAVKTSETVGEGDDATTVEKWIYEGVDGTEFVKVQVNEDGSTTIVPFMNGDKLVDMFGNEIEYVVSIGTNPDTDTVLDIDFSDALIDAAANMYAFDLDTLSAFLNKGLNNLLEKYNISLSEGAISTILGLVKTLGLLKDIDVNGQSYTGLEISGIKIPLINALGKIDIDIYGILEGLLSNLYSYQSSVIKPVWEFYVDHIYVGGELLMDEDYYAQLNYATFERAQYMAVIQGGIMGSTLIGDSLGSGAYPSALGLTDLASVEQLITDLSYQPIFFPLYALRDMLAFFTGLVILFYFASFLMAQKEEDCAAGKIAALNKKSSDATVIAEFDAAELENADDVRVIKEDVLSDKAEEDGDTVEAEEAVTETEEAVEQLNEAVEAPAPEEVEESIAETEAEQSDEATEEPSVEEAVEEKESVPEVVEEATAEQSDEIAEETVAEQDNEVAPEVVEDTAEEQIDEVVEEKPAKKKKGLFGKWKKNKHAKEPVEELTEEPIEDLDSIGEPVTEAVEETTAEQSDGVTEVAEDTEYATVDTDNIDEAFTFDQETEEKPVKEKKGLFGRKKKDKRAKRAAQELTEESMEDLDSFDEPVTEAVEETATEQSNEVAEVAEGAEDTALPVWENSDEEVL